MNTLLTPPFPAGLSATSHMLSILFLNQNFRDPYISYAPIFPFSTFFHTIGSLWYNDFMALTFITIKISNPSDSKKIFSRKFLVDSGAIYSVVDEEVLKKLEIPSTRKMEFTLANGQSIKKDVGEATFEFKGQKVTSPVIFGDKGVFLLGAVTLETFGLILDPIGRKLRGMPMLI